MNNSVVGTWFKGLNLLRSSLTASHHLQHITFLAANSTVQQPAAQDSQQQQQQPPSLHKLADTAVAHNTSNLNSASLFPPALHILGKGTLPQRLSLTARHFHVLQPRNHSPLSQTSPRPGRTFITHTHIHSTRSSAHLSSPSGGSVSGISTRSDRREGQSQRSALDEHPIGSERWNHWTQQLQLGGLSSEQAEASLLSSSTLLREMPPNSDEKFQTQSASLLRETGLTPEQLKQLLIDSPSLLRVTSIDGVVANLNWFKETFELSTDEWVSLALRCRSLTTLRKENLQLRMDAMIAMGMDQSVVTAAWIQNPELMPLSLASMQEKFEKLQSLFGISPAEIVQQYPTALSHPARNLRDRVLFLQSLGEGAVTFQDVQLTSSDPAFALQVVEGHLQASGKTLLQLCSELQAQPGVSEYLQERQVEISTMNEYKYFLVATLFARPPQDAAGGTPARTRTQRQAKISTSPPPAILPVSVNPESPLGSITSNSESGRPRGRGREVQAVQERGEHFQEWARQLQLLGLTQDQALATLAPFPKMTNKRTAYGDEDFKGLAAAILRDTGMTIHQLQQIAMHCPDLLSVTNTAAMVGNVNWFKVRLGVSTQEWVQLVCSCKSLLFEHKPSLQHRMDELTAAGLDRTGVKACWIQNPDFLKQRVGALPGKLALMQTLFPGSNGLEVLQTNPSVLLHPVSTFQDRALFLQKLGTVAVTLETIQLGISEQDFALNAVRAHLQANRKSLQQLCSELQTQPGAREYMENHKMVPATMNAHKCFLAATYVAQPTQPPSHNIVVSRERTSGRTLFPRQASPSTPRPLQQLPTPLARRTESFPDSSTNTPKLQGGGRIRHAAVDETPPARHALPRFDSSTDTAKPQGTGRNRQGPVEDAQSHTPGSERWNHWSGQLQLLGLTREEAESALFPVQPLLKRAPPNTDEKLRSLAAAIQHETGLTAEQLKRIAMSCPDLLRTTSSRLIVGSLTWFKGTLGVTTEEWVKLVCGCRALLISTKENLQDRVNDLLTLGLDQAAIKACWIKTPGLLKLQPGMLLDKVAVMQDLFPGFDTLEVLRTDPSALLHPSRSLRERISFLQSLGSPVATLADVRHGMTDPAFAVAVVRENLASSGKSLLQFCSDLQAQPGVREYMEANEVNPATMDEFKYFLVVTYFGRLQREPAPTSSGWNVVE